MRKANYRHARRGVLLLLILGLLAMFALVGVAFLLYSSQASRAAKTVERIDQQLDQPRQTLHQAMLQVIRGSNSPASVIGAHSLLETMYGNEAIAPTQPMANVTSLCGGQLFAFDAPGVTTVRMGCVLTMKTGACAGQSTRIVAMYTTGTRYQAVAFPRGIPANNDQYVINSVPFSGTGFGYNPSSGKLDMTVSITNTATGTPMTCPIALLPNHKDKDANGNPIVANPPGGANSDYTAVDFQHMLLGAVITDPTTGNVTQVIPSLHRPELVQYWINQTSPGSSNWNVLPADLLRQIVMAPNPIDHPTFCTLVSPNFGTNWDGNLTVPHTNSWDVDNDGDGIPDSVWVDLGMPVRSMKDGRQYKPLFAILCLDMDGRLNVNAHGCLAQLAATNPDYYNAVAPGTITQYGGTSAPNQPVTLPRGQGYGPPEVNLRPLFRDPTTGVYNDALHSALMVGDQTKGLDGRYGDLASANQLPGVTGQDYLGVNKFYDMPGLDASGTDAYSVLPRAYGSPPDLKGTLAVGLDMRGQPLYPGLSPITTQSPIMPDPTVPNSLTNPYVGARINDAYEMNLSRNAPRGLSSPSSTPDNPFSPAELEKILRPYDRDWGNLPQRLWSLTGSSLLTRKRQAVTTDSWDLPCPPPAAPDALRANMPSLNKRARHMTDLLTAAGVPPTVWNVMLPPDVLAGLKMNLNPPVALWGATSPFQLYDKPGHLWPSTPTPGSFNYDPQGRTDFDLTGSPMDVIEARQLQARYLYVMMLLLHYDPTYTPQDPGDAIFGQINIKFDDSWFTESGLTFDQKKELTIRRIAQWAINVVDFQSPDSIMTPFKYDINPFTSAGWRANYDLTNPTRDTGGGNNCRVVWGCKRPELLLTETLAFHDRRVADTANDSSGKRRAEKDPNDSSKWVLGDQTLDQTRIPQGSFFAELYCTNNPNNPVAPADLYTYDSVAGKWYLDLERMAPAVNDASRADNGKRYPVWRIVISGSKNDPNSDVFARRQQHPDTFSFEPEQYEQSPGDPNEEYDLSNPNALATQNVKIDRIIWFTTTRQQPATDAPTTQYDANRVYYNRGNPGTARLLGGQYAVVGPRVTTNIGSTYAGSPYPDPAGQGALGQPSGQMIQLDPTTPAVNVVEPGGTGYPAPAAIQTPVPIIVAGGVPGQAGCWPWPGSPTSAAAKYTIGSNVSYGFGISISEPLFSSANYYPEPLDTGSNGVMEWYSPYKDVPMETSTAPVAGRPLTDDGLLPIAPNMTTLNYKTVFLQRLANPLVPYHPMTNPYRTVDWMPVDLTVFNGEDHEPKEWATTINLGVPWDPDDPSASSANAPDIVKFATRQRGNMMTQDYDPWPTVSADPQQASPPPPFSDLSRTVNFPVSLDHSLGFINKPFWAAPGGKATDNGQWLTSAPYVGDPVKPFPWLAWLGRPFVNQMELLLVPSSHPGRLLWEYNIDAPGTNFYDPPPIGLRPDPFKFQPKVAYPNLLNFYESPVNAGPSAPQLHRILEYVYVPSRFVGTEIQANPANAASDAPGAHFFFPPFNRISTYREPGRINLNTIFSKDVFDGLMGGPTTPGVWNTFLRSRRGYDNPNVTLPPEQLQMANAYPTLFAGPFRSFAGGEMVPSIDPANVVTMKPAREVDATLLRSDATTSNPPMRLFRPDVFPSPPVDPYSNHYRNPYFRFRTLQQLGNVATTRSNVYAVWITVGYFEVKPNSFSNPPGQPDAGHPDGYELGQEVGSDTGEIERHRAFYIYDRTIPVGFQRGVDLNVEEGILVRRFIE